VAAKPLKSGFCPLASGFWNMKYIALIIIFIVCLIVGNYFRVGLHNRVIILQQIRYMVDEISMLIRYKSATVFEITDRLLDDDRLSELTFLPVLKEKLTEMSFREAWDQSVSGFSPNGFTKADKQMLAGIGASLGNSDTEGQNATLALMAAELTSAYEISHEDCKRKSKLYTSLGLLAGAFLAVILI
jgi:stage III sporulation protein AB